LAPPGKAAFITILVLGASTGIITYYLFLDVASPRPGHWLAVYGIPLSKVNETTTASTTPVVTNASSYANKVAITILQGASVQNNPNFSPDSANVPSNALITWTNKDSTAHTVTSGTGPTDSSEGKVFDSGVIAPAGTFSVPASKLGTGEHAYFCSIHPYMKGKITIK